MDEMEKALREELEKHLDTLRRNLEVVPMDVLKTKYKKPYQELKESICKAATAYTRHVSLGVFASNKSMEMRQRLCQRSGKRLPMSEADFRGCF